jgi:GntR family transcriptional regulator
MFEHMDALRSIRPLRQGDSPLHLQAENALRALADHPDFSNGALFPDEITLASRLGVSRGTVRAALSRMVSEGRVERKAGVGTRVVKRAAESAVTAWRSLSREMARSNIVVQLFRLNLDSRPAPKDAAAALHVSPNAETLCLDRVRGWDGEPVLRSRSWFHPRVRFREGEPFKQPLYDIIAQTSGLNATRAYEEFGAETAGEELSVDLAVERGAPLLLRRHTVFDEIDRPLEYAEVHYVSARFMLTLELQRGTR